jgi:hypothetical protein
MLAGKLIDNPHRAAAERILRRKSAAGRLLGSPWSDAKNGGVPYFLQTASRSEDCQIQDNEVMPVALKLIMHSPPRLHDTFLLLGAIFLHDARDMDPGREFKVGRQDEICLVQEPARMEYPLVQRVMIPD